jgi:hypothetical protein
MIDISAHYKIRCTKKQPQTLYPDSLDLIKNEYYPIEITDSNIPQSKLSNAISDSIVIPPDYAPLN